MPDTPTGIDPRGPRFAAAITTALLAVATFLTLTGNSGSVASLSIAQRASDAGFVAVAVVTALFLWSVASPATAPWGVLFRHVVRPRLAPPTELEDPRPPRFAQGVGLFVTATGLILQLLGVPWALPIATAAALLAAFLNAAFGFCLGCQIYLLLQRAGILGRTRAA